MDEQARLSPAPFSKEELENPALSRRPQKGGKAADTYEPAQKEAANPTSAEADARKIAEPRPAAVKPNAGLS